MESACAFQIVYCMREQENTNCYMGMDLMNSAKIMLLTALRC